MSGDVHGDVRAWLDHCASCTTCYRARADIAALRRGEIARSAVTLACPVGIRLMPIADVDLAAEPITRETGRRFVLNLKDCLVRRAS